MHRGAVQDGGQADRKPEVLQDNARGARARGALYGGSDDGEGHLVDFSQTSFVARVPIFFTGIGHVITVDLFLTVPIARHSPLINKQMLGMQSVL